MAWMLFIHRRMRKEILAKEEAATDEVYYDVSIDDEVQRNCVITDEMYNKFFKGKATYLVYEVDGCNYSVDVSDVQWIKETKNEQEE